MNQTIRWAVIAISLAVVYAGSAGPVQSADERKSADVDRERELAAARSEIDWTRWKAMPLMHAGRVKPIDTYAREVVLLVTAGRKWTDPDSQVVYQPPELLFAWIGDPDHWATRPVVRCEFQPLRRLLDLQPVQDEPTDTLDGSAAKLVFSALQHEPIDVDVMQVRLMIGGQEAAVLRSEPGQAGQSAKRIVESKISAVAPESWSYDAQNRRIAVNWKSAPGQRVGCLVSYERSRGKIAAKGVYISAADVMDWEQWTQNRQWEFHSPALTRRFREIQTQRMKTKDNDAPVGETAEDQEINEKLQELVSHLEAFVFASEARQIQVVPSLDPRILTKQTNPDERIAPWVSLGSLLRIEQWNSEIQIDPTVAAVMSESPMELLDNLVLQDLWRLSESGIHEMIGEHSVVDLPFAYELLFEAAGAEQALQEFAKQSGLTLDEVRQRNTTRRAVTQAKQMDRAEVHAWFAKREQQVPHSLTLTEVYSNIHFNPELAVAEFARINRLPVDEAARIPIAATVVGQAEGVVRDFDQLATLQARFVRSGQLPKSAYSVEMLPQLAQAFRMRTRVQSGMKAVKPAFDAAYAAYAAGNPEDFASTMQILVRNIRELGEALDKMRSEMSPPDPKARDAFVFAPLILDDVRRGEFNSQVWSRFNGAEISARQSGFSAYPAAGSTETELFYNRVKPFERAWIFFLLAAVVILLSHIVRAARICYLAGLGLSAGAIAYSAWGFYLRIVITQRAPVTNMYETVVWAAFVVAVLGLIFALQPVLGPGMSWSWRLTGFPLRLQRNKTGALTGVEADPLRPDDRGRWLSAAYMPIKLVLTILRLVFGGGLMWFLTSSETTFAIITPLPPIGAGFSDLAITKLATWIIGMSTVVLSAWYLPRIALALTLGLGTVWTEGRRGQSDEMWSKLLGRRFFSIPAMIVACFGMMLAHFVGTMSPEILNPEIGSIAAVLRNNYWLTIHVLTISASYGAGALAWGLGNLALAYYLVGKYRSDSDRLALAASDGDSVVSRLRKAGGSLKPSSLVSTVREGFRGLGPDDVDASPTRMRPPREVATLATFSYRVMQVAVLLLAAGTILGGLWADVSWGRFWDWDPKEVWALISLLVYLVVLHGRFAGWFGTLGTNVGSVMCFTAIIFSWYGVNFVLPQVHGWLQGTNKPTEVGLHSYATGAGGLEWVVGAVLLNMVFLIAAVGRFVVETRVSAAAPKPAE